MTVMLRTHGIITQAEVKLGEAYYELIKLNMY